MNQEHGFQPTPPDLCALPYAASRDELPTRNDQARARFRVASEAYEAGKMAQAAKQFLEVAELLSGPAETTALATSFARMRAAAYRNASMAFVFVRDEAGRKRAFTALMKKDGENAALLEELLRS